MLSLKLFFIFVLIYQGQCQHFGIFDGSASDDIFNRDLSKWYRTIGDDDWSPRPQQREDVENSREREPLGPDYKDPAETIPDPDEAPARIPETGVIDVDANGYSGGFPSSLPGPQGGYPNFVFPGFFNFFGAIRRDKPWWNGPNVCIEREEVLEDDERMARKEGEDDDEDDIESAFLASINLSTCRETFSKYECVTKSNNRGVTKTFTVKYRCCYGYKRTKETPLCTKYDLKSVLETIEELNATEFRKMVANSELDEDLTKKNVTVFVPTNQAINDFTENMLEMNQVEIDVAPARRRRDIRHILTTRDLTMNHMIDGFVDISDLENEETLTSFYNNSTIRFNTYPTTTSERLITANCVPIRGANNLAENGIVHLIDGVITPGQFTIKQILQDSKKLNTLKKILQSPKLEKLFDREGPFTFLAPTDEAFEKLDTATKQKLLRGDDCAINILQYHIIPHSICSAAINGNVTVHNIEGHLFNLERRDDDQLIIEDQVKIVKSDVIATNGVIQIVDTIMVPDSALHISQALQRRNNTKFYELIEKAGLTEEIDSMSNATLFAPTNEAINNNNDLKDIENDTEALKTIIKYHTLPGKLQSCDINNNALVETNVKDNYLRFNLFSTLPLFTNIINRATVNCGRLINIDEKSCGSVMHTIDSLLIPPQKTILQAINDNEEFSILSKVLKDTSVEKLLNDDKVAITFLAFKNEVFETLDEKELDVLLKDKEKANEIIKNHILTEILCCTGIGPQSWAFNSYVSTLNHKSLEIRRDNRHHVRIGKTTVTQCDSVATNGVIHVVNKIMLPSQHQYTIPGFGSMFMFEF